jgi:hypothetical protein
MSETVARRHLTALAACGPLFVLLFALGLVFADVIASDSYPSPDRPLAEIRSYFTDNADEVRALSFLHSLAAIALLLFSARLAALVRTPDGARSGLAALALGAGATAAAFLLASAFLFWTLAQSATLADPALTRSLFDLGFLAGGVAVILPLSAAIGAVLLATGAELHRWIRVVGLLAIVLAPAGALSLLFPPGPGDADDVAFQVAEFSLLLGFLWVLAIGIRLLRGGADDG